MKKFFLLAALVCCSWLAGAQQLECSFSQERTIKATGKTFQMEGVIQFKSPDQLTMTYTKPEGEYLIISGPMLRSNTMGKQLSVNTDKSPMFKNLCNTLLNCIMGDYEKAAEENDADLTVNEKGGVKTVKMTARKKLPRGYSEILMEYRKNLPVRMVLEEFGGIQNEYIFKY